MLSSFRVKLLCSYIKMTNLKQENCKTGNSKVGAIAFRCLNEALEESDRERKRDTSVAHGSCSGVHLDDGKDEQQS